MGMPGLWAASGTAAAWTAEAVSRARATERYFIVKTGVNGLMERTVGLIGVQESETKIVI
jgi:hypothetical protein